jgi:DNA-binding Xre family transcriptional regulator
MSLTWNLKKWLAVERNIYRPSELRAVISEKAGVHISLQSLSALINGQPDALRLQTVQTLCNALECNLSDFCEVRPDSPADRPKRKGDGSPIRLYGSPAPSPAPEKPSGSPFPDPRDFYPPNKPRKKGAE